MATLKNQKHERFVQMLIEGTRNGWTQGACYSRAGYRAEGAAAETNASRLLKNAQIQGRLAELTAPMVRKSRVTVESLLSQLEATIAGASEAKQFGAVNGSLALIGKLTGLLREKIEVGGPGDFDRLESVDEIARKTLDQLELDEALRNLETLRDAMIKIAAERARPVN
jgi:Terminase small subunit